MSDLPVFLIANLSIKDPDTYRLYEKGFFPILKKHGGEFITYDDDIQSLEGEDGPKGRIIILKFPSETAARNWYGDPDYQAISENRHASTDLGFLTMVHSLPQRGQ